MISTSYFLRFLSLFPDVKKFLPLLGDIRFIGISTPFCQFTPYLNVISFHINSKTSPMTICIMININRGYIFYLSGIYQVIVYFNQHY